MTIDLNNAAQDIPPLIDYGKTFTVNNQIMSIQEGARAIDKKVWSSTGSLTYLLWSLWFANYQWIKPSSSLTFRYAKMWSLIETNFNGEKICDVLWTDDITKIAKEPVSHYKEITENLTYIPN